MMAAGKPKQETGAPALANELDAVSPSPIAVKRIAWNVSQKWIGADTSAATRM